jgi:O-antigen/teichoic acid export membrane protein
VGSYGKVTKLGVFWNLLARGMNELVSIPTSMVLARLLTPYEFGIAAAAGFFVQLANRMTNFGFNTALLQLRNITPVHTATIFAVNTALGLAGWAVLALGAPWFGELFRSQEAARLLPVAGLSFAIGSLGGVPGALLARDLKFREVTWLEWLSTWTSAIAAIAFALAGYGYWSLIYSQLISATVQTIARFWLGGWRPRLTFSLTILKELLSFGLGIHAKRVMDSIALNVDNLVIGRTLGMTGLGFYDKAFSMVARALSVLNTAGPVVSLRVFAIIQDEPARFKAAYRKVLLTATFIAYPLFVTLIVVARDLFQVMYGSQWAAAVLPFQILCAAGMLKTLNAYASTATQAKGWIWGEVWRQCLYLALVAAGAAIGSIWGLSGASAGVLGAATVMTVLMHSLLRRATSLSWWDIARPQVPALACGAGLAVCLIAVGDGVRMVLRHGPVPWLVLMAQAATALVFYALFTRYAAFPDLRGVIDETLDEFAPGLARRLKPIWWQGRPVSHVQLPEA